MSAVAVGGKKESKRAPGPAPEAAEPSGAPSGASAGVPVFLRRSPDSSGSSSGDSFASSPSSESFESAPSSAVSLPSNVVVGGLDDPAEREAESVASAVVAGSTAPKPSASSSPGTLRRSTDGGSSAPAVSSAPASLPGHGPGTPMSPRTRGALEGSLGADLGGVRVHGDPAARATAASLGARAFAVGSGIFLGPGASDEDLGLMAHETTHVLQGGTGVIRRAPASGAPSAPPPPPPPAPAPAPAPAAPDAAAAQGGDKKKKKKEDKDKKKKKGGPGEKDAAAPGGPPAGGGGPADVEILMPEPKLALSPGEKAVVGKVKDNAKKNADANADLPPADAEVADARGAVTEPESQTAARGQEAVVADLSLREPPSPEIEELCTKIYEAIRAKRPPDEDELVDAKPQEAADAAGTELSASVEGDTQRVEGSYDAIDAPPAGTPEQLPEGMEPPPPDPDVPVAAAAQAAPDQVPPEEVSLDADVEASAEKMDEAGMNKPAALEVKSGPIAEAREAQGELTETAKKGPEEALAEQRAALGKAQGEMADLQAAALARLAKSRDKTVTGTGSQKTEMVGSEEQMREAAGKEARDIFALAQSDVRAQLNGLPEKAMEKWEQGKKLLSLEFEQSLARVKEWIDERHSGVGGSILSVVDYVAGLPDWVVEEYDKAEKAFGDGVCDLIREISSDVNTVVAACEQIVEDARADIKAVFDALPESLQGWADEQQAALGEQLDGLANEARETRDNFNKELTTAAASAVQEARSKIHELRQAAGGLLGRIANAIGRFLDDPLKFIIDGLLELVGIEPSRFWSLIARIKQVVADIVDDPLGFAGNLLSGIAQGFSQFFENFGTHLVGGFFDWLSGGLAKAGVQLPTDFSLKGILTFILQLMGITWDRIRRLLAKRLGDKNIALIEKAWELISTLIEKGPEGIFDLVKEKLDPSQIINQIIKAGVEFLVEGLIKAVSIRIIALFNPVGAIVQAIEAIYRVIKWVFENAARIFTLVETIVNGMALIVAGNLSGFAKAVENGLAQLIAPVIDFLADYLGLGGLPEKIKGVIEGMQAWVEGILDTVIGFLADKAQSLLASLGIGGKKEPPPGKESAPPGEVDQDVGKVVSFSAEGESHRLWLDTQGSSVTVMVASAPRPVTAKVEEWQGRLDADPALLGEARGATLTRLGTARRLLGLTEKAGAEAARERKEAATAPSAQSTSEAVTADDKAEHAEEDLAQVLEALFKAFGEENSLKAPIYALIGKQLVERKLPPDHDEIRPGIKLPEGYYLAEREGHVHIQRTKIDPSRPDVHLDSEGYLREGASKGGPTDVSYLVTDQVKEMLKSYAPEARKIGDRDDPWVAIFATAGVKLTNAPGAEAGALTLGDVWALDKAKRARDEAAAAESLRLTLVETANGTTEYALALAGVNLADKALAMAKDFIERISTIPLYFVKATDLPRDVAHAELVRQGAGGRAAILKALYEKIAESAEGDLSGMLGQIHHSVPLYLGGPHFPPNLVRAVGSAFVEGTGHELMHSIIDRTSITAYVDGRRIETPLRYEDIANKIPKDALKVLIGTLYASGYIRYDETKVRAPTPGGGAPA